MSADYIWVNRWDEFQTFQKKRGKAWAPPWLKLYTRILDDPAFLALSPETRSLLVGIWTLFARSRLTLPKDTRYLSRQLHQKVMTRQLDSLNHAGFIDFCSGTVLEHRRNAFWNSSVLEVEVEVEEEKEPSFLPPPLDQQEQEGRDFNGRAKTEADLVAEHELNYEIPDVAFQDIPS